MTLPYRTAALLAAAALSACVTRPPTIAHVHIGHAVTAVHVTPGHKGYVPMARQRATEAVDAAELAAHATRLDAVKSDAALAVRATDDADNFGLKQSITMAANHIAFAATSLDASANVIQFAPQFKDASAGVVGRCDYIDLLGHDIAASASLPEAATLAQELLKAARDNEAGVSRLNGDVQAMIAREHPAYRTVDEWYLFNLVRLPNGRWVFDKLGRGGNIDGYK